LFACVVGCQVAGRSQQRDCAQPHARTRRALRRSMAESEATTQFRELQKTYIETSSKLKQARALRRAAAPPRRSTASRRV